ncbi:MAG: hypothetical protein LBT99_02790 [Bifidobacteriaceae bacterium]|jgi:hypothetical protein|nr:hypothetical protein [Bifidobacteriaceae bacterium]
MNVRDYFKNNGKKITIPDIRNALNFKSQTSIVVRNKNNNYNAADLINIAKYINYSPTKTLLDLNIIEQDDVNNNSLNKSTTTNTSPNLKNVETMVLIYELLDRSKKLINKVDDVCEVINTK